jgi:hypothetical protein
VGTGKTRGAIPPRCRENDFQAALMAPTELLAEQHAATLERLLAPLALRPELLIGRQSAAEKQAIRARLAGGQARLAVGTHALMQESVSFHRLGLAVIDEQHRFGVEQRAALIGKGAAPDVLLLTATPIPRSLALTLYGDLDVSTLHHRPPVGPTAPHRRPAGPGAGFGVRAKRRRQPWCFRHRGSRSAPTCAATTMPAAGALARAARGWCTVGLGGGGDEVMRGSGGRD